MQKEGGGAKVKHSGDAIYPVLRKVCLGDSETISPGALYTV